MSKVNSYTNMYFVLLLAIGCKSQGIVTSERLVSSRHFAVLLTTDDWEYSSYCCEDDFGSGLASIRSQEEQNEINELIQRVNFDYNIWIGLSHDGTSYSWEDSSTSSFTNWCDDEPNETSCAQLTSSGCWRDRPCDQYHYALCRRGNILYSSNSNYLVVQDSSLLYLDAQAFCRDTIGTELATVTTEAEHNELLALIRSANHFEDEFYIGLDDRSNEGTLVWQDGTAYNSAFVNGKLCESNSGNEDCVYINEQDGCWHFSGCNFYYHFACNNPRTTSSTNYVAVDARLPFSNANEYCKDEYGTTLATISSASENTEVSSISYRTSWIGYNDRDSEGNFVWLSGSGSYTNWRTSTNEPNNFGPGEDCTIIYRDQNVCPGCWNDIDCLDGRAFVCNK